jgi:hypothetical protein
VTRIKQVWIVAALAAVGLTVSILLFFCVSARDFVSVRVVEDTSRTSPPRSFSLQITNSSRTRFNVYVHAEIRTATGWQAAPEEFVAKGRFSDLPAHSMLNINFSPPSDIGGFRLQVHYLRAAVKWEMFFINRVLAPLGLSALVSKERVVLTPEVAESVR